MKLFFVNTLLFVFSISIFAQITGQYYGTINPFVDDKYKFVSVSDYRFEGNKYYLTTGTQKTKAEAEIPAKYIKDNFYSESGTYQITKAGNAKKILFKSNNGFTYKKELGVLFNERRLFLFEGDELFFFPDEDLRWEGTMPVISSVKCSSSLKEGNIEYNGKSFIPLSNHKLMPWVEGVDGNGIGEWITVTIKNKSIPTSAIIISNGYLSFSKPELFNYNSRIKKIRIVSLENGIDYSVELNDSSDLKTIQLPKTINTPVFDLKIIIEDVYPGTKWQDTCLNMIMPIGNLPE